MARQLLTALFFIASTLITYAAALAASPFNPFPPHALNAFPKGMPSDVDLAHNPFYRPLWEMYQSRQSVRDENRARMLESNAAMGESLQIPAVVTMPAPSDVGEEPHVHYSIHAKFGVTGRLATIRNPLKHWHIYTVDSALGTCTGTLALTSTIARMNKCTYGTNGGPFSTMAGATTCLGAVVSDGVITSDVRLQVGSAAFGLTKNGQWSMGYGLNSTVVLETFEQLVTGFGWLVYNGSNVADPTIPLVAPRTTIGVNAEGHLLSFVAEGSESAYSGLTLTQAAEWMVALGAVHVINLDGGGSSASWWPENQGNHMFGTQGCPTCIDIPFCCERSVETITCVK